MDLPLSESDSHTTPSRTRNRQAGPESDSQKIKREKAAERQRRKRKRDRESLNGTTQMNIIYSHSVPPVPLPMPPPQMQHMHHDTNQQQQQQHLSNSPPSSSAMSPYTVGDEQLSPDEHQRRERVRAAARERQRKHRQLVKARKMRDMGMDLSSDMMPIDNVHYRVNGGGDYPQMVPHEIQTQPPLPRDPQQIPQPIPQHEPPFPHGQPLGGQTFASTLLLSFSCAPLLKQHLLRTLSMTNEELASLEPIIAEAWDHWDHGRRMHYAELAAKANGTMPMPPFTADMVGQHPFPPPPPQPNGDPNAPSNDFRARFARSLVAPSPFRIDGANGHDPSQVQMLPHDDGSETLAGRPNDTIDPHLGSNGLDDSSELVTNNDNADD